MSDDAFAVIDGAADAIARHDREMRQIQDRMVRACLAKLPSQAKAAPRWGGTCAMPREE